MVSRCSTTGYKLASLRDADVWVGSGGPVVRWSGGVALLNHRLQAFIPPGCGCGGGSAVRWCCFARRSGGVALLNHRLRTFITPGCGCGVTPLEVWFSVDRTPLGVLCCSRWLNPC